MVRQSTLAFVRLLELAPQASDLDDEIGSISPKRRTNESRQASSPGSSSSGGDEGLRERNADARNHTRSLGLERREARMAGHALRAADDAARARVLRGRHPHARPRRCRDYRDPDCRQRARAASAPVSGCQSTGGVVRHDADGGVSRDTTSFFDFSAWQQSRALSGAAAYRQDPFILSGTGDAEALAGLRVSHEFLAVLRMNPVRGAGLPRKSSERASQCAHQPWPLDAAVCQRSEHPDRTDRGERRRPHRGRRAPALVPVSGLSDAA